MKTNIVAPVGGLLILAGGLALAFYTGISGSAMVEAHNKAVVKYIDLSEKAISKGDLKKAEKYAKEALIVDPKNKKAIAEFKKVILAGCKTTVTATSTTAKPAEKNAAKPAAAATPAPAKPEAESEEEMGCI